MKKTKKTVRNRILLTEEELDRLCRTLFDMDEPGLEEEEIRLVSKVLTGDVLVV